MTEVLLKQPTKQALWRSESWGILEHVLGRLAYFVETHPGPCTSESVPL